MVDPREEPPGTGLLTGPLAAALHHAVDHGGRAVCLLNRRGRARLLACVACNELARCERCGAFVEETDEGTLRCAGCGLERPVICLHCHATRLKGLRLGVSRVREDLAALLPRVDVVEVDASTDQLTGGQVFIGTEAVLHRLPPGPPVLLAAFLDFDQELLAPRYRAAEQALGLLARGGPPGRAARRRRPPAHPDPAARPRGPRGRPAGGPDHRRRGRAAPARGARRTHRSARSPRCAATRAAVTTLIDGLRELDDVDVFGPTTAASGLQALLHSADVQILCDALDQTAAAARAAGRLRIAVDPLRGLIGSTARSRGSAG